jgi:Uma2 family endonuclease
MMIPFADVGQPTKPFRWSTERYLALVGSGIMPETPRIELIEGQVVETMPQGGLHMFLFAALQRAFASIDGFERGLVVQPTVVVGEGNVFDPEFAFLRPAALAVEQVPTAKDVLMVVEVAVSSKAYDLGAKKAAYAAAGIPVYWVVDGLADGVWCFERPLSGRYDAETFVARDQAVMVPTLGSTVELKQIFPPR